MDINNHHHKLSSSATWEASMENHIINDHISLESFWPNFVAFDQSHQIPSSSLPCQISNGNQQQIEVEVEEEVEEEEAEEELGAMKEMMFKIAAMQPVDIDPATIRKPKRRNVRISDDPQSVAARHRRERISEKIRILQRLVPGGTKMDTASMLDEAIRYVKFLKRQIRQLQSNPQPTLGVSTCPPPATWTLAKSLNSTTTAAVAAASATPTYNVGSGSNHPICFNNEVIRE